MKYTEKQFKKEWKSLVAGGIGRILLRGGGSIYGDYFVIKYLENIKQFYLYLYQTDKGTKYLKRYKTGSCSLNCVLDVAGMLFEDDYFIKKKLNLKKQR